MSPITTHILDVAAGKPASGVNVTLERQDADGHWRHLAKGRTDDDGRCRDLLKAGAVESGHYRLVFEAEGYFAKQRVQSFYKSIPIQFQVDQPGQHYHVPLLLSPFGYSTYRGS